VRLTKDAARDKFDAVIIQNADRWDRGSKEAKHALEVFLQHGIRFFISTTEYDLHNPDHILFLELSAAIGKFHALNQTRKSLLNRIARAKRGIPTGGALPYGRTFDKESGTWGINGDKARVIQDVARRFLAGESLLDLADEYGTCHAQLCNLLRHRCGPTWEQRFRAPRLAIDETVVTPVPALLDDATIAKVGRHLDARRTYQHRPPVPKNFYLLSGRVFCAACGHALSGTAHSRNGRLSYVHTHKRRRRPCPLGRPELWVRAEVIERAVLKDLLSLLGNPAALARAVKAALPDTEQEQQDRSRLENQLAEVNKQIANIVRTIGKGLITDDDAAGEMAGLKERKARLTEALARVNAMLADIPSTEEVRCYVEKFGDLWMVSADVGEDWQKGMWECYQTATELTSLSHMLNRASQADRLRLVEAAFAPGDRLADGSPVGVYLESSVGVTPRQLSYRLRGRLLPDAVRALGQMPSTQPVPCAPHPTGPALPFVLDGVLGDYRDYRLVHVGDTATA
jgi:hypothetical protein